jgi:hypothetical protein
VSVSSAAAREDRATFVAASPSAMLGVENAGRFSEGGHVLRGPASCYSTGQERPNRLNMHTIGTKPFFLLFAHVENQFEIAETEDWLWRHDVASHRMSAIPSAPLTSPTTLVQLPADHGQA